MGTLRQDIAFALRTLRRRPAYAGVAIATIALGIGAATSMYSVVDGVLLQPLPYRDPSRLVTLYTTFPEWQGRPVVGALWNRLRTPYPDYTTLINNQRSFEGIAGFQISSASLSVGDQTISIGEGSGTANLLPVLGVSVAIGRWFLPGEDGPGAPRLVVLSQDLWRNRFGADTTTVGHTITVDERPFTVIGVLARGFSFTAKQIETSGSLPPDLWIPFGVSPNDLTANNHTLELIGRLRRGVSPGAALADVEPLLRGGRPVAKRSAALVPRAEAETGEVRRPLLLLLASVGLVLLITCGNVAMLFLSECALREAELRTRAALGAVRARLVRLLLTESAVIAAAGAAVGVLLAWWGTRVMLALAPAELPHARMVGIDTRVCLFTVGVATLVALIAGLLPALTMTRAGVSGGGASNTRGRVASGRSRLHTTVIALQACVSVVLMAGAGLLIRSVLNEHRVNPGFRASNMLTLRVDPPRSLERVGADRHRLYADVARALQALPGVRGVTATSTPPLSGRTNGQSVSAHLELRPGAPGTAEAERAVVLPNYFAVLGVPLLAGRVFTEQDVDGTPLVSVVSETFARRFWPGERAVGKQFRSPAGVATVIGIAGDVKNASLMRAPEALFYQSQAQNPARLSFIVNTAGDPLALSRAAERVVWAAVPGATVSDVTSLDALLERALAPGRYRALLASIFATLALLLTAVGLAGLATRAVALRLRELCIRMALGSTAPRAVALALRDAVGAVAAGLVIGLMIAPVSTRLLSEYLYLVSARDATTFSATALTVLVASAAATTVAAKRLWRADLAEVLRSD